MITAGQHRKQQQEIADRKGYKMKSQLIDILAENIQDLNKEEIASRSGDSEEIRYG